jgi:hypothetical protein
LLPVGLENHFRSLNLSTRFHDISLADLFTHLRAFYECE